MREYWHQVHRLAQPDSLFARCISGYIELEEEILRAVGMHEQAVSHAKKLEGMVERYGEGVSQKIYAGERDGTGEGGRCWGEFWRGLGRRLRR